MSNFIENIKTKNFEEIKKSEITADDIREFALNFNIQKTIEVIMKWQ